MSRILGNLTAITLQHDYYTDGLSSDLLMVPTAETIRLIKRYRLIFGNATKATKSKYLLLQETVGGTPLVPLPEPTTFRFALLLTEKSLYNFTDLDTPANGEVYVFDNSGGAELVSASPLKYAFYGGPFTWSGIAGAPATVTATHIDSGDVVTETTFLEGSLLQARFDLTSRKRGLYALRRAGELSVDRTIYYDPEFSNQNVLGFVHLRQTASLDIAPAYTLSFTRKEVRWKFFVVLKGDHSAFTYTITDERSEIPEFTFATHDVVSPAYALTDADQATLDLLADMYPSGNVSVFVSSQDIPYTQATRSLITLSRYNTIAGTGTTSSVIQHLSNPPINTANPVVIVGIDPPNP
jgi:hypothetical protein